jgi:hypothetical protein
MLPSRFYISCLCGLKCHACPVLQVFAKGAKFSMFKPAEEMVYIGLDEQSRTKGKAAIDVVGAQTGKSVGSILQQARDSLLFGSATLGLDMHSSMHRQEEAACKRSLPPTPLGWGVPCRVGCPLQELGCDRRGFRLKASFDVPQFLLVVSSGSIAKSLPIMAAAYFGILRAWSTSVVELSQMHVCAFTTHSMDMDETDSDAEDVEEHLDGIVRTEIGELSPPPSVMPAGP